MRRCLFAITLLAFLPTLARAAQVPQPKPPGEPTELQAIVEARRHDNQVLDRRYQEASLSMLKESFSRAEATLHSMSDALEMGKAPAKSAISEPGERRLQLNTIRNALDLASIGRAAVLWEIEHPSGAVDAGHGQASPLARTPELKQAFDPDSSSRGASTELAERYLKFTGLSDSDRQAMAKELILARNTPVEIGGKKTSFLILNNGGTAEAASQNPKCAAVSTLSTAVSTDLRKSSLTTLDYTAIYGYLKNRKFVAPPEVAPERKGYLEGVAASFEPVDLYKQQALGSGDILVERLPGQAMARAYVVRSFDPHTLTALLLESGASGNDVRERSLSLLDKPLREGLSALRLKPAARKLCAGAAKEPSAPSVSPSRKSKSSGIDATEAH